MPSVDYHDSGDPLRARVAALFQTNQISEENQDIMKKIYIYQEDKTILYEYIPNTRASKFTKQKLTELG